MSIFFLKDWLQEACKELKIFKYSKIQSLTIPEIIEGHSCIGVSATGTGKTYCFLLPILNNLNYELKQTQVIIILPTRELARQINSKLVYFKKFKNFSSKLIIGGTEQIKLNNENIIVSTPQKFLDKTLAKRLNLSNVRTIVFDEADMLIDVKSSDLFKAILELLPDYRKIQKIAFSATLHEMLANQLAIYFKNTKIIDASESIWKNKNKIKYNLIHIDNEINKIEILKKVISEINPYFCIIFANRKTEVEKIYYELRNLGIDIMMLHGGLKSRERKNTYKNIENIKLRFLVSTDLASRGFDIQGVSHIISYNFPDEDLWFMHRMGRTARNNESGITYTLADKNDSLKISRLKKKGIDWVNFKYIGDKLVSYNFKYRKKPVKKNTQIDKDIKFIIATAPKKIKPGYRKKTKIKIAEVKRKAKRSAIEKSVKAVLIKKYKIENAKKTREKNEN
ncbi:MAG: DEAD/DEAH box helicase [Mycoplasmoidaceae bacterium]